MKEIDLTEAFKIIENEKDIYRKIVNMYRRKIRKLNAFKRKLEFVEKHQWRYRVGEK